MILNSNNYCFVKFEIQKDENYTDLLNTFNLIKEAKNLDKPQSDDFWLQKFPKYSLEKFYFSNSDIQPNFKTSEVNEFTWHFYSLIESLTINLEIEYIDCTRDDENFGIINFNPHSFPYGGVSPIIAFIRAFDCLPTKTDDGTGVYNVNLKNNGDFTLDDFNLLKINCRKKSIFESIKDFFF